MIDWLDVVRMEEVLESRFLNGVLRVELEERMFMIANCLEVADILR